MSASEAVSGHDAPACLDPPGTNPSRTWRGLAAALAIATMWTLSAKMAHAVNADPYDYVPLPPGSNFLLQYLQFSDNSGLSGKGGVTQSAHLQSEVGLLRYIHYATLFGMTIDPQIIIPFGSINDVQIAGVDQKGSSGFGDPIAGGTIWPINIQKTATYLGITPLVTFPLGRYQSSNGVNFGNNRYQANLQIGFTTAFGSTGLSKKISVALYGDVNLYSDNTRYIERSRLSQGTNWQLQPWLTYNLSDSTNVSVGYSSTFGGRQSVGGVPNGTRTAEQQFRLEVQSFVTKRFQVVGELTRDIHVLGGFHQTIGANVRLALLF